MKASCEALGTLTLLEELGAEATARVHVDASAAKGIIERTGLDKIRHIDVNVLWLQEQEVRGRVPLRKIDGTKNPADLMTKHLEVKKIEEHLERLGLEFRGGRAQAAANLYSADVYDNRKVIWESTTKDKVVRFINLPKNLGHLRAKAVWGRTVDAETGETIRDEMIQDLKGWELMKSLDYPRRLMVQFMSRTGDDEDEATATTNKTGGEGGDSKVEQETEKMTRMAATVEEDEIRFEDDEEMAKDEGNGIDDAMTRCEKDRWETRGNDLLRIHVKMRRALFTPIDVKKPEGETMGKAIGTSRRTEGEFADGRKFQIVDEWTELSNSHRALEMPWTGTTTFS